MASIINRPNGHKWIQFADGDRRKTLRLGKRTLREAEEARRHVEEILSAKAGLAPLAANTARWLTETTPDMHKRFVSVGLVAPRMASQLEAFLMTVIETAPSKHTTKDKEKRLTAMLVEYFGPKKELRSITTADADEWYAWLRGGYASTTSARMVRRAKTFFRIALRRKLVDENPFLHLKATSKIDKSRQFFVTREMAAKVLDKCPSIRWRLIFSLARFAGLRVPSELAVLRWADVDWAEGTIGVHSPKTGFRVVPIVPELRREMDAAFEVAGEDGKILPGVAGDTNLGSSLHKILERAGIKPWPKTFHNLRATCETEWLRAHPIHVVCSWIGNSPAIALEHYAMVQADDMQRGAAKGVSQTDTLDMEAKNA